MLIDAATQSFLAERRGQIVRWLVWVTVKDRSTGATTDTGFWTGAQDATFTVDGASRSYFGGGDVKAFADLVYEAGTTVRMQSLTMAPVSAEVESFLRTYDPRLAPVEIHLAIFDPDDGTEISITRAFKGWIDKAPIRDSAGPGNAESSAELQLASSSREGTRGLTLKKSDSAQQLRSGDRGRRYADISGSIPVWWGEVRDTANGEQNTESGDRD